MDRRGFILAALALGGCATVGQPPGGAPPAPLAELEPLYGMQAGREGLTIRVRSGGCTAKQDFAFYVDRRGGAASIAFGRKHVETCKPVAAGQAELTFGWAELGLAPGTPVFVLNPVAAAGV
ncbi:MAG TPA: hypothetical protein VFE18_07900 [Phenylobacterium sp.]|jgi:hypothetical protein|uniref:hypothetical protein n=1 Tax=Phenylobacterium sp. TaxID=1871053 RepID=UPI002D4F94D6|nr:hypothetical protein [Phenylobacterium sp.]HZZ68083.1 hypothetical protein [Phenylobacterium sp.]